MQFNQAKYHAEAILYWLDCLSRTLAISQLVSIFIAELSVLAGTWDMIEEGQTASEER